ncbi:MAG TPA: glutamyl-tRNA reductase [Vicinamibacterales bacterium]|nr:glutamyl-tRNA reductase [Vicinamibacterales bacterium]
MSHPAFDPVAPADALDSLRVFSLSHRTCGLSALAGVVAQGDAVRLQASLCAAGVDAIVLSTCNRFEVYWRAGEADDHTVRAMIDASLPAAKPLLQDAAMQTAGADAVRHLFRVCSGLESMVLGEAEILGQVRTAMEQSPFASPFLKGIFTAGIRTGRTARAATGIAHGAMSVASVAVRELRRRLTLPASRIVVIGAGETAAKVTRHVAAIGVASLVIANRTLVKAHELAVTHGGRAIALDALAGEIARADAVICAAGSEAWMVKREHVGDRRTAPLVLVDLAMPPGIEPFEAEGVTRIDLPAIEQATAEHRRRREDEIPRVDALIARELAWLQQWAARKMSAPVGRPLSDARS